MTLTEARAAWVAANPFPRRINVGGEDLLTTQAEYDAMADDRAQMWLERVTRDEAEAAYALMVTQFTDGLTTLNADLAFIQTAITNNTNLTQAQIKMGFRDLLQSVIWLAERIKDGSIETRKPPS